MSEYEEEDSGAPCWFGDAHWPWREIRELQAALRWHIIRHGIRDLPDDMLGEMLDEEAEREKGLLMDIPDVDHALENDKEDFHFSDLDDEDGIGGEVIGVCQTAQKGDLRGRPARIHVRERKKRNGADRMLQLYQQRATMAKHDFVAAARQIFDGKEVEGIALMEDVVRTVRTEVPGEAPVDEAPTFIPPRPARPASDKLITLLPRKKHVEDEDTEEAESACSICWIDYEDE